MTVPDPATFGAAWAAAWNAHDLDALLAHFHDDVVFTSPVAAQIVPGSGGVVRGKDALRAYWTTALQSHSDLHFELDDVHLGIDAIAIRYRNQAGRSCMEIAVFDADGRVARGWGLYDAG
jgi:ketosteroid isomerase-like protein